MIDHRIHGVAMLRPYFLSASPITPKPKNTTSNDSSEIRFVDVARTSTCPALPARTARIAVIGRMAIGPTMNTADTTCSTAKRVSILSA